MSSKLQRCEKACGVQVVAIRKFQLFGYQHAFANGQDKIGALKAGLERIQQVGGVKPGDRTVIDALAPALDELLSGLNNAATAARVEATARSAMRRARAGRASYVSEKYLIGHNNPGAEAVAHLFEQLVSSSFSLE